MSFLPLLLCVFQLIAAHDGLHAGNVFFDGFDTAGILKLVDRVLEAQVEKLFFQLGQFLGQLAALISRSSFAFIYASSNPSRSQTCT
jgi:hypothetical protein